MLTAKDMMISNIITIRPDATIEEAVDILMEKGISGLPVTDGDGQLLGVITEFAMLATAYDPKIISEPVSQHMTRDVICVEDSDTVSKVTDIFILHRIRRVPVMHEGRLVGLISRRDVLRTARESHLAVCSSPPVGTGESAAG